MLPNKKNMMIFPMKEHAAVIIPKAIIFLNVHALNLHLFYVELE